MATARALLPSIRLVTRSGRTRATAPNSPTNGRLAARDHIPMDEICPLGAAFCFHRLLLIYRQRNAAKADSAAAPRPTYTNSSTMGEGTGEIDDGHTAWILMSCALVDACVSSYELPLTPSARRSTS